MPYRGKIVPGLVVELEVPSGEYKGKYRTHVDEVGETKLSIYAPMEQGSVIPLHEGTKVTISFWDENAAYHLSTKIIQRIANPVAIFVLEMNDTIKRIQRRSYVRVPATYTFEYRIIEGAKVSDPIEGKTVDISGGGIRFETTEALKKNDILHVILKLPTGVIRTPAEVRRVQKIEDTKLYSVSVWFYQLKERERDRIVRHVFQIQREMRKKGLI